MQNDIVSKLREVQRHLVEIARACDAASIHIRTVLREMNAGQETQNDEGRKSDD